MLSRSNINHSHPPRGACDFWQPCERSSRYHERVNQAKCSLQRDRLRRDGRKARRRTFKKNGWSCGWNHTVRVSLLCVSYPAASLLIELILPRQNPKRILFTTHSHDDTGDLFVGPELVGLVDKVCSAIPSLLTQADLFEDLGYHIPGYVHTSLCGSQS